MLRQNSRSPVESSRMSETSTEATSTDTEAGGSKKLHEIITKNFNRAPNGKILAKNVSNIFAMLILCLDLQYHPVEPQNKTIFGFRVNQNVKPPFSFTLEEAINKMQNLEVSVNLPATTTVISYSVKSALASALLKKFMKAKLLHCPSDRTRSEIKDGIILQPTPKGCAVLHNFCLKTGLKEKALPSILYSTFNSMNLIFFERHPTKDSIAHSDYLIYLLFLKFAGPTPNVWSASKAPDPIPKVKMSAEDGISLSLRQKNVEGFSAWLTEVEMQDPQLCQSPICGDNNEISPFYHKFFTNPESEAHVQYYESNTGVRLFHDRLFANKTMIRYCFSGKAAIQWFMDCTDVFQAIEAAELISLFIKAGLVEPVCLCPSTSTKAGFKSAADSFYTLTKRGLNSCDWFQKAVVTPTSSTLRSKFHCTAPGVEKLSLSAILKDPGSKYLFRKHLEQDMCVENLDMYSEMIEFHKQMTILKKVLKSKESYKNHMLEESPSSSQATANLNQAEKARNAIILRTVNSCLSKAYEIYSSYLSYGAPYETNISDSWKRQAQSILIRPHSNFEECFPKTPMTPVTKPLFDPSEKSPTYFGIPVDDSKERRNSAGLKIDLGLDDSLNNSQRLSLPATPTTTSIKDALQVLFKITPLFKKINQHIFMLLSRDSFPKFIQSGVFKDNSSQVNFL